MSTEMTDQIAALKDDADWSDPGLYAKILGTQLPDDDTSLENSAPPGDTDQPRDATTDPAAKPESSAPPAAAEQAKAIDEHVEGVVTKDGKRVIPYAVLSSTRQKLSDKESAYEQLKAENARLAEQLQTRAAAPAQPQPAAAVAGITPEKLAEMERDFPEMAALARSHEALRQQVEAQAAAEQQQTTQTAKQTVQELIDARPMLATWQAKGGVIWDRAVELDVQLRTDPAWAGKSMAERFVEVEKQMADELGIPLPADPPVAGAPAQPNAQQPPQLPAAKPSAKPSLSDLSGTAPRSTEDQWNATTPRDALARAHALSEAELMRMAGVNW